MKRRHRGYTLLELTVTLLILGIAGVLLARWAGSFNEQRQYGQQRELIQRADDALTAFAAGRARLPCPASSIDGNEDCNGQSTGLLPWRSLGLPDASAARLHYAVLLGGDAFNLTINQANRSGVLQASSVGNNLMATVHSYPGSPHNSLDLCRALDSAPVGQPLQTLLHGNDARGNPQQLAYALAVPAQPGLPTAGSTRLPADPHAPVPPSVQVTPGQLWARLRCSDGVGPALQSHPNAAAAATVSTLAMRDYSEQMAIFQDLAVAADSSADSALFSAAAQLTGATGGLFDVIGESWATYGVWTWRIAPAVGAVASAATNLISAATFKGYAQSFVSRSGKLREEFNSTFPPQASVLETELAASSRRADQLGLYPDQHTLKAVAEESQPVAP